MFPVETVGTTRTSRRGVGWFRVETGGVFRTAGLIRRRRAGGAPVGTVKRRPPTTTEGLAGRTRGATPIPTLDRIALPHRGFRTGVGSSPVASSTLPGVPGTAGWPIVPALPPGYRPGEERQTLLDPLSWLRANRY